MFYKKILNYKKFDERFRYKVQMSKKTIQCSEIYGCLPIYFINIVYPETDTSVTNGAFRCYTSNR